MLTARQGHHSTSVDLLITTIGILVVCFACKSGSVSTIPVSSTSPVTAVSETSVLRWDAPSSYVDGSPLTDQLEYRVYYRSLSSLSSVTHDVGSATTCLISDLSLSINVPYSLVATAVTPSGVESDYSNEIQIIRK